MRFETPIHHGTLVVDTHQRRKSMSSHSGTHGPTVRTEGTHSGTGLMVKSDAVSGTLWLY